MKIGDIVVPTKESNMLRKFWINFTIVHGRRNE